ncbi:MAG: methylmalonyl Co-A mutase-associated GTPase MeaB [Bacteroidales bacterium]|nr:methylmalonyl Co-A mutase-associated GTPase MeaB [Bacteroidales bacterium]MBN2757068.1 methylmalonyl Co-A mutase-associated GTPase MeaB [Bacteroidales bacterium]
MKGIKSPSSLSAEAANKFLQHKKKKLEIDEIVAGIFKGDISTLSSAITLVESNLAKHREISNQIIEKCLPKSGNSIRIGITGVPGVGKSTFIEALGMNIIKKGHKLAVLAIDPSSEQSGGSILGDKTRMENLSAQKNAFIRPSPSSGSLGGVARKTRETILLCEAAGFDIIFIETVGVGQSETKVHSMVDFFLLLMLAGAGDELQGIKRGIMEMADTVVINKADGNNIKKAQLAKAEYQNALHLFPPAESGWIPNVLLTSAIENLGIDDVWNSIIDYKKMTDKNNFWQSRRQNQAKFWMHETILESLKSDFFNNDENKKNIIEFETKVINGEINPFNAAKELLDNYFNKKNS